MDYLEAILDKLETYIATGLGYEPLRIGLKEEAHEFHEACFAATYWSG